MTRGYIVLIKGKKYYKVAEMSSSAYFSFVGKMIADALSSTNKEEKLIKIISDFDEINVNSFGKDNYSIDDKIKVLIADGTIKDKKDGIDKYAYFYDYTYEYNIDKNILTIYHFGEKIYTFKSELDFEYFNFLTNEDEFSKKELKNIDIESVLSYNFDTLEYDLKKYNPYKQIRKYMKSNKSIDEFKHNLILKANKIKIVAIGKYQDVYGNLKSFKQKYEIILNDGSVKDFFVSIYYEDFTKSYEALMQFPTSRCRIDLNVNTSSSNNFMKVVNAFVASNVDDFEKLCDITTLFNETLKKTYALENKNYTRECTISPKIYGNMLRQIVDTNFTSKINSVLSNNTSYLQGKLSIENLNNNFNNIVCLKINNYQSRYSNANNTKK